MTKLPTVVLMFAMPLSVLASEDHGKEIAFERQIFSPTVIGSFGIDPTRLKSLTEGQKKDIAAARQTLVQFMKAAQAHEPKVGSLVERGLLARYPSETAFLEKLFGQETEVSVIAVTDFALVSLDEISISFYIVLFSEGRLLLREDKATLRKSGGKWRIAAIGGL